MNRRLLSQLLIIIAGLVSGVSAQEQHSLWLASFNTFRIDDKFSLHLEAQVRTTGDAEDISTVILRPGINYHLSKKFWITVGYAYVLNRKMVDGFSGLLPEHRIWLQGQFFQSLSRTALTHRLRFEERFLPNATARNGQVESTGYNDAQRLRYFIRDVIPLAKVETFKKGFFVGLQNEVFLNIGDKSRVNGRTFDQNRLYGALGYRFPNKFDIEVGYMYQYQMNRDSSSLKNHIVQFAVYRRL